VIVRSDTKEEFKMHINQGLIHVKADIVRVFIDV
jgi:hypothetical protein